MGCLAFCDGGGSVCVLNWLQYAFGHSLVIQSEGMMHHSVRQCHTAFCDDRSHVDCSKCHLSVESAGASQRKVPRHSNLSISGCVYPASLTVQTMYVISYHQCCFLCTLK